MKKLILSAMILLAGFASAANTEKATITVKADQGKTIINKNIYGQFSEHLGSCIYGGLWVGKDSKIPNQDGYRLDVLNALKELHVPLLRWPGGCFADEYHWRDGIGPQSQRPTMVNNNWGGIVEDNSFGTNEFLNLCEILGCEPYVSLNLGSGTVQEMADWIEYMTSDGNNPMANLRRKNGREKPWHVKYIGIGNESWGCGGQMTPEYYSNLYRRYANFCRNYGGNELYKIASGASDYDYNWTEVLMKNVGGRMNATGVHYYTTDSWSDHGSATDFSNDDYYQTLGKCLDIENVVKKHIAIMDKYDSDHHVDLFVDEWGTWFNQMPGAQSTILQQQNTMRDAMVASLTLDVFNKYSYRIKGANIAQVVNVLQAMIMTRGDSMFLTPTYYVFDMYKVHQNATYLPIDIQCDMSKDVKGRPVPAVSATASKKDGVAHISLTNTNLDKDEEITVNLEGLTAKNVTGQILTVKNIHDVNTFAKPNKIKLADFKGAKLKKGTLTVKLPAKSIVTLELK